MKSERELITRKYTFENWRTREMTVHEIPGSVCRMPVEKMFYKLFADGLVNLNPVEQLLYLALDAAGWNVARLPLNRSRTIDRYRWSAFQQIVGTDGEAFFGQGVPDFFIWDRNSRGHRFVEVKHSEWTLSAKQQAWAERSGHDLFVARLAPVDLSDDEIKETNRCRRVEVKSEGRGRSRNP